MKYNKEKKRLLIMALMAVVPFFIVFFLARRDMHGDETLYDCPAQETKSKRTVSIMLAGDLMQHLPQVEAARTADGFDYSGCFEHIGPLFRTSDVVIVNLETTLAEKGPFRGYPLFCSPWRLAHDMFNAGMTTAVTANNHSLDKGLRGVINTIAALDSAGIRHTGVFTDSLRYRRDHPLLIEANDIRFALLNYTYGTNGIAVPQGVIINLTDTVAIKSDIVRASSMNVDFIMAFMHWGDEYHTRESPGQRELAGWLHRQGVRFVIGSHPHVVQPLQIHTGPDGNFEGITVFSLGNFVSNQTKPNTDGGIVVRLTVTIDGQDRMEVETGILPVWTYKTRENGKTSYAIIPGTLADSLLVGHEDAKRRYETFLTNLKKIIDPDKRFNYLPRDPDSPEKTGSRETEIDKL